MAQMATTGPVNPYNLQNLPLAALVVTTEQSSLMEEPDWVLTGKVDEDLILTEIPQSLENQGRSSSFGAAVYHVRPKLHK
jgi:hypothetical protein